jgi:protein-disulfide isomerase
MSKKSSAQARAERAAAALAEQRRQERRRTFLSVTGVVVAMALIVAAGFLLSQRNSGPNDAAAETPTGSDGVATAAIGRAGAGHQLVVWEDFLCPFCGELEKQTRDGLAAAAAAGKVQVTYRPFNLLQADYSETSLEVFAATRRTAGDEVAKKLHDLLYENQPEETAAQFPTQQDLVDLAVRAGADRTKVQQDLDSGQAKAAAEASTQAAADAGVQSTPTVLLDGSEVTGRTVDDIAAEILKRVGG